MFQMIRGTPKDEILPRLSSSGYGQAVASSRVRTWYHSWEPKTGIPLPEATAPLLGACPAARQAWFVALWPTAVDYIVDRPIHMTPVLLTRRVPLPVMML
jgi:hypothetical protein